MPPADNAAGAVRLGCAGVDGCVPGADGAMEVSLFRTVAATAGTRSLAPPPVSVAAGCSGAGVDGVCDMAEEPESVDSDSDSDPEFDPEFALECEFEFEFEPEFDAFAFSLSSSFPAEDVAEEALDDSFDDELPGLVLEAECPLPLVELLVEPFDSLLSELDDGLPPLPGSLPESLPLAWLPEPPAEADCGLPLVCPEWSLVLESLSATATPAPPERRTPTATAETAASRTYGRIMRLLGVGRIRGKLRKTLDAGSPEVNNAVLGCPGPL
ncbi:MAG: hypothetical protein ACOYB7_07420 [Mycobacterium sp.]